MHPIITLADARELRYTPGFLRTLANSLERLGRRHGAPPENNQAARSFRRYAMEIQRESK